MDPHQMQRVAGSTQSETLMHRALGVMSIFTILMTIPQIVTIWIGHQAAGVSVLSWSAYLVSAVLWFLHGLRQHDRNIYWPCVAWIAMDVAVIAGVVVYG